MSDYSSTRSAHLLRGPHENVMGRKHMTHREAIFNGHMPVTVQPWLNCNDECLRKWR